MNFQYTLYNIRQIAEEIVDTCRGSKIFCFEGELGAGKTTLIEEICRALGSLDKFSSPSYAIINEYSHAANSIIHADLYRLKSPEEAVQLGIEEYLHADNYCFIEWYQIAESIIPRPYYVIKIETSQQEFRKISIDLIS